jgi:phytoene dehydrogenase-like protein
VIVEKARATGVRLETGEEIGAPHVISSADPRRSFSWIDPMWLDPEFLRAVDNIRMRGSTARVHYALDAMPKLVSGGVEVSRDALGGTLALVPSVASIERAYDAAKFGEMPSAPALSVAIPTLVDPSLAPDRKHVLSVTVHHAPYALTGGWNGAAASELGAHVTGMLSSVFPDIRERVLHQWVLTPADLESRYGCTEGNLSHGELALDQFLFMRPLPSCARYATPIPGFSLCGTGSHPGLSGGAAALMAVKEVA